MIRTTLISAAALTALAGAFTIGRSSAPAPSMSLTAQPEMEMDMDQVMEMMQKAAAPGEHHAKLTANSGKWTSKTRFTMGPGQVSEGDGKLSIRPVIGDRFTLGHYTGDFMGAPFEGMSITGYDNVKEEYVSVWLDNFGTGILYMTGNWEGDALVLAGKTSTIMGESEMKISTTQPDAHTMIDTFYEKHGDEWVETGTIHYSQGADHGHDHGG